MAAEKLLPLPEQVTRGAAPDTSLSLPPPSTHLSLGPRLRFVRLELHDQGGMGRVWVARDTSLDRDVALKELHPELVSNPNVLARFLREARITGQLEHPGVVPVYEFAESYDQESPFYTMRFVKGRTLTTAAQEYCQKRAAGEDTSLDLSALLHAFVMVCNTVGYAHSRGVIHRDLKGQNVILGDFGEVVLLDWGLAKVVGQHDGDLDPAAGPSEDDPVDTDLTQPGLAMGTPASMAPEQAAGQVDQIDHRTDIYGLGGMLYEILTGKPPFTGSSTREVLRKVLEVDPVAPRLLWPDVPHGLEAVCLRALAKEPLDRFPSAKEMGDAVQQWQEAERRLAEQALRASEEKYHSLADLIPGIVWTSRPDGWIDYANQFWFKFTGLTMAQTEGAGWAVVLHPDDLPRVSELWTKALQSGEPIEVDYRVKREDGVYRWFLAQARPVRDPDGKISKWFGMLTEIEDQKRGEKELARQNSLMQLLHQATVSAYEATSVTEAFQAVIDLACAFTQWPIAHVYVLGSRNPPELLPAPIWHLDRSEEFKEFVQETATTRLAEGAGLPGRVLADQAPVWIMDVSRDNNFPRAKAAAKLGIKGAFGVPVTTSTGVRAVLEFFTCEAEKPDEMLVQSMAQIGVQLGQVLERRLAKGDLSESTDEAENLIRASFQSNS